MECYGQSLGTVIAILLHPQRAREIAKTRRLCPEADADAGALAVIEAREAAAVA
jgi:hypothetical protein